MGQRLLAILWPQTNNKGWSESSNEEDTKEDVEGGGPLDTEGIAGGGSFKPGSRVQ